MFDNIESVQTRNGVGCMLAIDLDKEFWVAYVIDFISGTALDGYTMTVGVPYKAF